MFYSFLICEKLNKLLSGKFKVNLKMLFPTHNGNIKRAYSYIKPSKKCLIKEEVKRTMVAIEELQRNTGQEGECVNNPQTVPSIVSCHKRN